MTEFVVQKGVPIPPSKGIERSARETMYPFASMEVGDSFSFDFTVPGPPAQQVERLRSTATAYGRKHNKKFVVRAFNGKGGVWRVL